MLTARAIPGGFFVVRYRPNYIFLGQTAKGNNMQRTKEMSKEVRKSAESIEAVISLLDLPESAENLLRRLIDNYGSNREADGFSRGKMIAEQEQRSREFRLASFNEQRNKELMHDVVQCISDYLNVTDDDIPF